MRTTTLCPRSDPPPAHFFTSLRSPAVALRATPLNHPCSFLLLVCPRYSRILAARTVPVACGGVAASRPLPSGSGGIVPPAVVLTRHPCRGLRAGASARSARLPKPLLLPFGPSPPACCGIHAAGRLFAGIRARSGQSSASSPLRFPPIHTGPCGPDAADYRRHAFGPGLTHPPVPGPHAPRRRTGMT
jgi:hypothetical protein